MEGFNNIYNGKNVFVTGHTGFKGSWLCLWLEQLGAHITGFSDKVPTRPAHFPLLSLEINDLRGDIRDKDAISAAIQETNPDIIFHLAAQPLVRLSYQEPIETFETNVLGTIHVMEAARKAGNCGVFVNITSDKCYENREWEHPYKETDHMGGYDPYSASKGCAELITSSWRRSFMEKEGKLLASTRAGNVIGGGDWAADRLLPDIFRATAEGKMVKIRKPLATRPWQHVLEPIGGYLLLGQKLLEGNKAFADGWNFGPDPEDVRTVQDVLETAKEFWNNINYEIEMVENQPHEAGLLRLDIEKAKKELDWHPKWHFKKTIETTVNWYKDYYQGCEDMRQRSLDDLKAFIGV